MSKSKQFKKVWLPTAQLSATKLTAPILSCDGLRAILVPQFEFNCTILQSALTCGLQIIRVYKYKEVIWEMNYFLSDLLGVAAGKR